MFANAILKPPHPCLLQVALFLHNLTHSPAYLKWVIDRWVSYPDAESLKNHLNAHNLTSKVSCLA